MAGGGERGGRGSCAVGDSLGSLRNQARGWVGVGCGDQDSTRQESMVSLSKSKKPRKGVEERRKWNQWMSSAHISWKGIEEMGED